MRKLKPGLIKAGKIELDLLGKTRIAIIGYGSQGRAQALNLRDSGFEPVVGLPSKSRSRILALKDGFRVATPRQAVKEAGIIAILVPDHKHKELFDKALYRSMRPGHVFIFAHALSVHFNLVIQPDNVDFILVAPHSPGVRMRERFLSGKGVTAFIGATESSSKASLKIASAYASAIGCDKAGIIVTSFGHEAVGDIFGEQVVLCGGLSALLKAGFDTLVKAGIPPENAYLECIHQIDLIVDLIKSHGIRGMYDRISRTAAYGAALAESKIINDKSKKAMKEMLRDIDRGDFVKDLMADYAKGFKKFKARRKKIDIAGIDKLARYFSSEFGL